MAEATAILTRLTTWRRASAILGLVALALLNVTTAVHQFEHTADHDDEHHVAVCETCAVFSQLEDTVVPTPPVDEAFVAADDAVITLRTAVDGAPFTATHRSRAPPLS